MANQSSGEITATGLVYTGPVVVKQVHVCTDGTNDATAVLDDSVDGSGTDKLEVQCDAATEKTKHTPPLNIDFIDGVYVTLTGTGASVFVDLEPA